ncbi:MAG: S8 family peptidase [Clostridia bacterium]|nr:S8 family peptidase [Clostridia bacterium]
MSFKLYGFGVESISAESLGERIDYGVKMVGAPLEWEETDGGRGVPVGIIDTGVEYDHEDLSGAVTENRDFTDAGETRPRDENGHGTHVAGIIAARRNGVGVIGVAPECRVYSARAFEPDGSANIDAVTRALEWLIDENVDVINMSFSAARSTKRFASLIREAYERGICLVSAAGNDGEGDNIIGCPARFEECIAVTAVDIDKKHAPFSTGGKKAEVCAAGTNIYSCYKGNAYAVLSGTSMATPVITGAIALLQAKARRRYGRRLTPAEVRLLLHMYAEKLGAGGRDENFGYGLFTFDRLYYDAAKESYVAASSKIANRGDIADVYAASLAPKARGRKKSAENTISGALLSAFLLEKKRRFMVK